MSPNGRVRTDGEVRAGEPWQIVRLGLNVKRYPVCYAAHRAIDAMLALRERDPIGADAIGSIDVTIGRSQSMPTPVGQHPAVDDGALTMRPIGVNEEPRSGRGRRA